MTWIKKDTNNKAQIHLIKSQENYINSPDGPWNISEKLIFKDGGVGEIGTHPHYIKKGLNVDEGKLLCIYYTELLSEH